MESPTNVVQHVNVTPGSEKKPLIPEFIELPTDNIHTFEKMQVNQICFHYFKTKQETECNSPMVQSKQRQKRS